MEQKQLASLNYGIGSNLSEELKEQKLKFDKNFVTGIQKHVDGTARLKFQGFLTELEHSKVIGRIHKCVAAHLARENDWKYVKAVAKTK